MSLANKQTRSLRIKYELTQLSREIEAAGQVLTSKEELEQELARRRGGYTANGVG